MSNNIITKTDSYKVAHWDMYPVGTEYVYSYFESRKGAMFDETVFFGLQGLLKNYFTGVVVTKEKIDAAEHLFRAHFGSTKIFNRAGWEYILNTCGGKLPIEILAVPEGTPVTVNNVLMTVVNTDPKVPWLTNYVETLLTHVWASSTVGTLSREVKKRYKHFLDITSENNAGIDFMLHDFGYRGVTSDESAGFTGAAHLINFKGTDTLAAMEYALEFYGADLSNLAFSVPATEHSIMTSLGREGEWEVVRQLLNNYPTGVISVVSDSYDIYNFVDKILGIQFKDRILSRDGVFVVRPDSGDPEEVVTRLIKIMGDRFGYTVNRKGYKVLNPKVRLIWGDGIDIRGIQNVLGAMMVNGWSAENILFGMGGGLLQKINRDTQRFAFKSCAQCRDGTWHDIWKDPIDKSKMSKKGKLKLIMTDNGFETVSINTPGNDILLPVYKNGELLIDYTFDRVRNNAVLK